MLQVLLDNIISRELVYPFLMIIFGVLTLMLQKMLKDLMKDNAQNFSELEPRFYSIPALEARFSQREKISWIMLGVGSLWVLAEFLIY